MCYLTFDGAGLTALLLFKFINFLYLVLTLLTIRCFLAVHSNVFITCSYVVMCHSAIELKANISGSTNGQWFVCRIDTSIPSDHYMCWLHNLVDRGVCVLTLGPRHWCSEILLWCIAICNLKLSKIILQEINLWAYSTFLLIHRKSCCNSFTILYNKTLFRKCHIYEEGDNTYSIKIFSN
jgi:hypothetical protein